MEKRKISGFEATSDGTFDMSPAETAQFARLVGGAASGWYVVAIRPSGVNLEGPLTLSVACQRQRNTRGAAFLFNAPEGSNVLRSLLLDGIEGEMTFSFDVEDGEIREGNFNTDGEVLAIIGPGLRKWRAG